MISVHYLKEAPNTIGVFRILWVVALTPKGVLERLAKRGGKTYLRAFQNRAAPPRVDDDQHSRCHSSAFMSNSLFGLGGR